MQDVLPMAMHWRELWDPGIHNRDNTGYEDGDYRLQCLIAEAHCKNTPKPI